MITTKKITFIPNVPYAEYSAKELVLAGSFLPLIEQSSDSIWIGLKSSTPIFVVGVQKSTYLSMPRMWFLLCQGLVDNFTASTVKGVRKAMRTLDEDYGRLETLVEQGWKEGHRFARAFGFRPTPRFENIHDRTFVVLER